MSEIQYHSDLSKLIDVLPPKIKRNIQEDMLADAIEIVLDIGRLPEIRFGNGKTTFLGSESVSSEELDFIVKQVPEFTSDNRSGIAGTLHRISAIRNRQGKVIGLTCRIGRVITGTIVCIKDFVMQNKSILFLGRPGVGKTTKLREISRLVADELHKRVVVVDTSNEIAGDGDVAHPAIGRARRMQVPQPEFQKDIMIEAVENHTPEVIVVDEIGTELEAQAARTIAERGVMLIATAHGNTLENIIKNPAMSDLVGGVSSVTLGDEEAKHRGSQKTVLEREKHPTFDIVIEIIDRNTLAVYKDTALAVDHILRGWPIVPEIRKVDQEYCVTENAAPALQEEKTADESPLNFRFNRQKYVDSVKKHKKIYIYAVSRSIVDKIIERLDINAEVVRNVEDADFVIAHKNFAKGGTKILSTANEYRLPVFFVRTNSASQIQKVLKEALNITQESQYVEKPYAYMDETELALNETKAAIAKIYEGAESIELEPQQQQVRKLQHELVEQHNLSSKSVGEGSTRHLKIVRKSGA
ncbi:ycf45 protein [Candidatus Gastranaerophilus sp. (ex Termes propinquus)]|nr:ycf45 protein [Candidatus Gastranaerophilus sp. (ex Termes propinquus)]